MDEDLTAVAAAIHENTQISNGKRITTSSLNIPIQSYLVAFAAGDIACQQVNERISVYTEPSMLEACSFEFSITEEYLSAAE